MSFVSHLIRHIKATAITQKYTPSGAIPFQSEAFIASLFFGFEVAVDVADGKVVVAVLTALKQVAEAAKLAG